MLVSVLLLTGIGGYVYVRYRFGQIHKVTARHLEPPVAGMPFNILLVGSDTRAFVDNQQQANAFGTSSQAGGQRSDVTMVARVVPATHQVTILSIPRDVWVDIPGNVAGVSGQNRINAAFDSGPDLLIQTIEQQLGIPINHFAEVDFPGFQGMVDALGGINLDFPVPVKDAYSGLRVTTTGCQLVDGAQALALVRSRHLYYYENGQWNYDGLSDFSRIRRQDVFFRAMLDKVNASLTNPLAINAFIGAAVHNLTIDSTLTAGGLFSLANTFRGLSQGDLHTETLPTIPFTTPGGADVLQVAQPYASQMISQFLAAGTPQQTTTTTSAPVQTPGAASPSVPSPTTSTTIPSSVVTNTQPEPWNPVPCSG